MPLGSQPYLNILEGLNLYKPTHVYNLDNAVLNNTISTVGSLLTNNSLEFSNTLLSRTLLPNTPIQQIANVELAKSLLVKSGKNLRTELLPSISQSSILDIKINKPISYWRIDGKNNKTISQLVQTMLSYQMDDNPVPFISDDFTYIQSNEWLKKNRGQGQIDQYTDNISRNKYSDTGDITQSGDTSNQYGKNNLDASTLKKGEVEDSLLYKTNQLLDDNTLFGGIPSDNTKPGDTLNPSAKIFKYTGDDGVLRIIPKGDGTTTADDGHTFLRVFTKFQTYASTANLMKYNHGTAGINSVLQTVFPNIAPLREDTEVKNLMFSIENLAYKDAKIEIKANEKGPNEGRVMWFAPYDLKISENTSVELDKVKFIGRSEPIYTYNGSERQFTLSFTLIVDYPSEFNKDIWKTKSNNEFNKFFRQNNSVNNNLSTVDKAKIDVKAVQDKVIPKEIPQTTPINQFDSSRALKYYFDNNDYSLKNTLTEDNTIGTGQKAIDDFNARINTLIDFLNSNDGQNFQVLIDGFTSSLDSTGYNQILSFFRGKSVYDRIVNNLNNINNYKLVDYTNLVTDGVQPKAEQYKNEKFIINFFGETKAVNKVSTKDTVNADVIDRKIGVYLKYNAKLNNIVQENNIQNIPIDGTSVILPEVAIVAQTTSEFYFDRYKKDEEIELSTASELSQNLLKTYADNLKYFHPIFHSQTPEDLNSRITFLEQCTRQGRVLIDSSGSTTTTQNSIFGRPPVCVIRIGDLYHTKMVITSISKDFEPLIWDMNPEGIGMQPMICKVTMNCYLIGGSSLAGPIKKLQSALDYNFYANTEVYNQTARDAAADEETIREKEKQLTNK